MKRLMGIIATISLIAMAIIACGNEQTDDSTTHVHEYKTVWTEDDTNHWHECSCGDKSALTAHTAGDWQIDNEGNRHKKCTVCEYVMETVTIQELSIYLCASNDEFLTEDGTETVYFYAEVEGGNSDITINLVDSNGNIVAEMKDDGKYSVSGDDIQNDKVFSAKLEIDLSTAGTHTYVAQDSGRNTVSNVVTVYIIPSLTDQDFVNIAIVQAEISTLKASDEYAGMNVVERAEAFHTLLTELVERSLIIEGSILYNESSNVISFKYSCGLISSVRLLEY